MPSSPGPPSRATHSPESGKPRGPAPGSSLRGTPQPRSSPPRPSPRLVPSSVLKLVEGGPHGQGGTLGRVALWPPAFPSGGSRRRRPQARASPQGPALWPTGSPALLGWRCTCGRACPPDPARPHVLRECVRVHPGDDLTLTLPTLKVQGQGLYCPGLPSLSVLRARGGGSGALLYWRFLFHLTPPSSPRTLSTSRGPVRAAGNRLTAPPGLNLLAPPTPGITYPPWRPASPAF